MDFYFMKLFYYKGIFFRGFLWPKLGHHPMSLLDLTSNNKFSYIHVFSSYRDNGYATVSDRTDEGREDARQEEGQEEAVQMEVGQNRRM